MWDVAFDPTVKNGRYGTVTVVSIFGARSCTLVNTKALSGMGYVAHDPKARNLKETRSTVVDETEK